MRYHRTEIVEMPDGGRSYTLEKMLEKMKRAVIFGDLEVNWLMLWIMLICRRLLCTLMMLLPIWKISHGAIPEHNRIKFENRKVAVVHSETGAKATSKITQGQSFMEQIRKGDYFYLCYGNSIRLLGQFTGENAVLNPEMSNGWYEREYKIIEISKAFSAYNGVHKWWAPNDNPTCIKVEIGDKPLFETEILKPYFGMTLNELYGKDADASWILVAYC